MPHYQQSSAIYFGDIRFEKLPHTMISRSAHPIIALDISFREQRIFYVGSASAEVGDDFIASAYGANAVIFGSHGPNLRENMPASLFSSGSYAVFANSDVNGNFDGRFDSYRVLIPEENYILFVFE